MASRLIDQASSPSRWPGDSFLVPNEFAAKELSVPCARKRCECVKSKARRHVGEPCGDVEDLFYLMIGLILPS